MRGGAQLRILIVAIALLPVVALAEPVRAVVGEGTATPSFNESWACDQPSTNGPYVGSSGWLSDSEPVRGYRGDFFGRNIGAIRDSLVYWTVPMSGGYRILVHERVLPALARVTANLQAEQDQGNYYAVKPTQTYAFAPRTISGTYRLSLHGNGIAIDINSGSNPYRSDGTLITDMPAWFVDAWRDAGFCWGGDWSGVKDPMHFSWQGPQATSGYGTVPMAYPVTTNPAPYTEEVLNVTTQFGTPGPDDHYLLGDANGNGLADVFHLVERDNGTRLEHSLTHLRHDWCAVTRDLATDVYVDGRVVLLGDYSRVGRNDLWLLDTSGDTLQIEIALKPEGFFESTELTTTVPVADGDAYLLGDHNRDGYVDLYVIRRSPSATIVDVYSGEDQFATLLLETDTGLGDTSGSSFTLGDPNLDELPDLFVVTPGEDSTDVRVLANGYTAVTSSFHLDLTGDFLDVLVNDYDGDGRGDLWFWDSTGTLRIRLGNTPLPGQSSTSWQNTADWACDPDAYPYHYAGAFRDDEGNIHELNIDEIAARDISRGCNPPYNDEYCPDLNVTRGEMAAFLVRALGLTDDGGKDWFGDDDGNVFEQDINRLAAAGVTKGCDPPANTSFCPQRTITRAEMAAFLVRGLGLTDDGGQDWFRDDVGSIFELDINRLAAAGITKGCNPPANDRYCPTRLVGRDEMASFLARSVAASS
jgi:hypothetical protein